MATITHSGESFRETPKENPMTRWIPGTRLLQNLIGVGAIVVAQPVGGQTGAALSPAEGYNVHVTAPHVVAGITMGPYHHYCKVLSPEPVIQCLVYSSTDANARLEQVEYIIAKSITRNTVPLRDWNRNWHDHSQEIATGRVQVHDLPPDKASEVAALVSTTDGIIFHLWSHGERVPSGRVTIAQSVGHVKLSKADFAKGAVKTPPR
jgi:hypothetical protein